MGDNYKRDAEFKADAVDGDEDGFVQDGTIHERPVESVVVEPEPEAVEEPAVEAAPAAAKKVKTSGSAPKTKLPSSTVVSMAAIDFASHARNSASVAAVQVRLIEMGHYEAGEDKRGDIGDGTCKALCAFQEASNVESVRCNDQAVIEALFDRTTIKIVP